MLNELREKQRGQRSKAENKVEDKGNFEETWMCNSPPYSSVRHETASSVSDATKGAGGAG